MLRSNEGSHSKAQSAGLIMRSWQAALRACPQCDMASHQLKLLSLKRMLDALQIEFSGYTLAPLQPYFANHDTSQETLVTHIMKVQRSPPLLSSAALLHLNRDSILGKTACHFGWDSPQDLQP